MIAASWPRADRASTRLLWVERSSGAIQDRRAFELPQLLKSDDLLVVNDAAALPASLLGQAEGYASIELRLLGLQPDGSWHAVLFSGGNWRTPTERRPAPPHVQVGTRLKFAALSARVAAHLPPSPRLMRVRFDQTGSAFWSGLYRSGRPVQYAYLSAPLALWHVQNSYAARPWAAEAPSAGFIFTGQLLGTLRHRGIELCALTHAAGLSATGDAALDAALPLAERFEIPNDCVERVMRAKKSGRRVIAVGTSVVRALESRALEGDGQLWPGLGSTDLRIGPGFRPQLVDGLLSGVHDPSASHYALLQAFVPGAVLERASRAAEAWGYLCHEFGDAMLVL